jgi:Ferritin-like domain
MHQDHIRRIVRDSERQQREAMPRLDHAIARFLDRDDRTTDETSGVLLGGMSRRSLFRIGGITVAGAALMAACGDSDTAATTTVAAADTTMAPTTTMVPDTTMAPTTTAAEPMTTSDIVLLRTASSIEQLAVAAYQLAIDSGLVTTVAVVDAAKLFQDHHRQHAEFFQKVTVDMGGTAFTDPNPAVLAQLQPSIDALQDEQGAVRLALLLERAAAATYQAGVGTVMDLSLNQALMSVGGVEARHATALASALGDVPVPAAYGTLDGAIAPGTGV